MDLHQELDSLINGLGDSKHLVREKALKQLNNLLQQQTKQQDTEEAKDDCPGLPCELSKQLWEGLNQLLKSNQWEARLGGINGLKVLVERKACSQSQYVPAMLTWCLSLYEDSEPRVRTAVAELLGSLSGYMGAGTVWDCVGEAVLTSINNNFDRDALQAAQTNQSSSVSTTSPSALNNKLQTTPPTASGSSLLSSMLCDTYKPAVMGQGEMRHGSEGWRCLESSVRCVTEIAKGGGDTFSPYITRSLVTLTCRCMHHPNRFVRETAHSLAGALCEAHTAACQSPSEQQQDISSQSQQPQPVSYEEMAVAFAPILADGLTDNWSQVRYSACQATRSLLLGAVAYPGLQDRLLADVLPPLCLNRYFVADGVRRVAQDTWRVVMQDTGRQAVAQHIDKVCEYYIAQSKAVHHGAREAACACIAELAEKVDSNAVAPHIPGLMAALLICCKDMAWPVRDAGCVAAGRCARALPEACHPFLQRFLDVWVAHLWDNVQSVRANSARALADALHAYPTEPTVIDTIQSAIRDMLPKVQDQPREYPRGRSKARDGPPNHSQDLASHTDQSTSRDRLHASSKATSCPDQESSPTHRQCSSSEQPSTAVIHQNATSPSSSSPSRRAQSPQRQQLGRPRSRSPSAGRPLSPARLYEQQMKELLAADPDMFGSGEDIQLLSDDAIKRFSANNLVKGDGCMDFGFSRDQEPWEATDGALFLITELCSVKPDLGCEHLQSVVTHVARAQGFDQAYKLRQTLWQVFPRIGKAIGKQRLKRHLELFLGPMFDDLTCGVPLTEAAAGTCIAELRDLLGPNIFAARLTDAQANLLRTRSSIPVSTAFPQPTCQRPIV